MNEETKVKKIDFISEEEVRVTVIDSLKKEKQYRAKFLLDASGRDSFVANKMKTRQPMKDFNRSALHAHWRVDEMPKELKTGVVRINYTGGNKKGWIWSIPNSPNQISIGVVISSEYLHQQRKIYEKAS